MQILQQSGHSLIESGQQMLAKSLKNVVMCIPPVLIRFIRSVVLTSIVVIPEYVDPGNACFDKAPG